MYVFNFLFKNYECITLLNYKLSHCIFCFWQSFLNMQLYEKALDLFEDDQSTSVRFFHNDQHF